MNDDYLKNQELNLVQKNSKYNADNNLLDYINSSIDMLDLKLNFDILKHKVDRMNEMASKIFDYKSKQKPLKFHRNAKIKFPKKISEETTFSTNNDLLSKTQIRDCPPRQLYVTNNNFCIVNEKFNNKSIKESDEDSRYNCLIEVLVLMT
jgi:hypothetical protein